MKASSIANNLPVKKILIVDNNPVIRKMLSAALEKEHFQVDCAVDGLSAFDTIQSFCPDIIFLDLIMPNINGEQFCQMIKDRPELSHTKIVVISGVAVEARGECNIKGIHACIAKGPNLVRHVVDVARRITEISDQPEEHRLLGTEDVFPREISKELLAANRHLQVVLNNMNEGIVELATDNRIIFANPAAAKLVGIAQEGLLALHFTNLFAGDDQQRIARILQEIGKEPFQISEDNPVILSHQQVAINFLPVYDKESRTLIVIIQDINRRKIAERQLRETKDYLHSIFNSVQSGILIVDPEDNIVIDANPRALELFGETQPEMLNRVCDDFDCPVGKEECHPHDGGKSVHQSTKTVIDSRGNEIHILTSASSCTINGKQFIVESFLDITEQKKLEEKLHSLSITDELTGLLNRRGFMMLAKKQLQIADRSQGKLYLLYADVDNLKWVNDTHGHEVGDLLLVKVSKILSSFRSSDIIARLGGDEFAVLVSDSSATGGEEKLAERFKEILRENNEDNGLAFDIGISFGVVAYDLQNPCQIEELIARADKRMYSSKKERKTKTTPGRM